MAFGSRVSTWEVSFNPKIMSLYLTRAGKNGENEQKFLKDSRIYFTWSGMTRDLRDAKELPDFYQLFGELYPQDGKRKIQAWSRQAYQFTRCMKEGDWVVLPSKFNPVLHFGKVLGPVEFNPKDENPYKNSRRVEWFATDIPRARFDQDILYSFGAFLTVCEIHRNKAEARVKEMASNAWNVPAKSPATLSPEMESDQEEVNLPVDLEETAYDQISSLIMAKFQGHGLATLVRAILQANGYTVHQPSEGPDNGVDLLAAPGELGFGQPRLCAQVKSSDSPVERAVLDQLIGTMQNHQAHHGLLVSWGGFKQTIEKERAAQFFRVRLWNRDDLISNLLACYDKLEEEIRTQLPLKRIWCVAQAE